MRKLCEALKSQLINGIDKCLKVQYQKTGKANVDLNSYDLCLGTEHAHDGSWDRFVEKVWKWNGKIMFSSNGFCDCEVESISDLGLLEDLYNIIVKEVNV